MIGQWNNDNCVAALLPRCLRDGSNSSAITSGNIPVYRGPQSAGNEVATLVNYAAGEGYTNGKIVCGAGNTSVLNFINNTTNYTPSNKFTITLRFLLRATFPSNNDYIANIPGTGWGGIDLPFYNGPGIKNLRVIAYAEPAGANFFTLNGNSPAQGTVEDFVVNGEYEMSWSKNGTSHLLYVNSPNFSLGYKLESGTDSSGNSLTSQNVFQIGNRDWPSLNVFRSPCPIDILSCIIYNTNLTEAQMDSNYNLGASLGLRAFDIGNGTVDLIGNITPENNRQSFIGIDI